MVLLAASLISLKNGKLYFAICGKRYCPDVTGLCQNYRLNSVLNVFYYKFEKAGFSLSLSGNFSTFRQQP